MPEMVMRFRILLSALLLVGCAEVRVIGPYKTSLSKVDIESVVQIAHTIERGSYSRLIINAVGPNQVYVDAVLHGGSTSYDYSAIRRGGIWKRGRFTPPPID